MAKFHRKIAEAAPPAAETLDNIEKPTGKWKDLNFKVDPEYHFYVSNLATQHRISKVELLRRAIALYTEKYGGPKL